MADTLIPVVAKYIGSDVTALRELTSSEDIPIAYIPDTIARVSGSIFIETTDTVYNITDDASFEIDPSNGNVQTITLSADRTPTATNFASGQCILLGIDDGTAYTITWTSVSPTWVSSAGSASAPSLATTGYTWILLWKVSTTIYGALVGKP